MTDHQILVTILNRDPDGMPSQPTDAKRAAFRAWVVDTYGQDMLDRYHTSWNYA